MSYFRVEGEYLLEKFPGKGGWTYARIPELVQDKSKLFGWVVVKGSIDDYKLDQYKLMPMGDGKLFLPVKAAIRKKIKKEAGDYIQVILEPTQETVTIPKEIEECFEMEDSQLLKTFTNLSLGAQKTYLDWIYEAKKEETKVQRITQMMINLEQGKTLG